ncbi:hypothetical protein [Actinoplanes friuliensis]|uniref:Uncharacterized protein n=1 Tax=Actinoplanes friuliensis DSM 7358 TaxID=1246995 RepID=U5VP96_9ACTN|nr:hypothetical protein [Actinoplanes friuliensis]AGZ38788.1 hypothetical protein AFR_02495 [Actinoplanes friuliensis DSM 7358]
MSVRVAAPVLVQEPALVLALVRESVLALVPVREPVPVLVRVRVLALGRVRMQMSVLAPVQAPARERVRVPVPVQARAFPVQVRAFPVQVQACPRQPVPARIRRLVVASLLALAPALRLPPEPTWAPRLGLLSVRARIRQLGPARTRPQVRA